MKTEPPIDDLTNLVLEVFRFNGRLIAAGDALVAPIGLTSARWQVMGAIALSTELSTVAELARAMGLARQSVQRIVNDLKTDGIVRLADNPRHERAPHVIFTKRGSALYAAATRLQKPWAKALASGIGANEINRASELLRTLRLRLESGGAVK